MNTPNNRRSLATEERLKNTLMALLKDKELADISVTELCEAADIDRSTFYAHYLYKRIENGNFRWPRTSAEALEISPEQYRMLMQGLEIVAKHPIEEVREPSFVM